MNCSTYNYLPTNTAALLALVDKTHFGKQQKPPSLPFLVVVECDCSVFIKNHLSFCFFVGMKILRYRLDRWNNIPENQKIIGSNIVFESSSLLLIQFLCHVPMLFRVPILQNNQIAHTGHIFLLFTFSSNFFHETFWFSINRTSCFIH